MAMFAIVEKEAARDSMMFVTNDGQTRQRIFRAYHGFIGAKAGNRRTGEGHLSSWADAAMGKGVVWDDRKGECGGDLGIFKKGYFFTGTLARAAIRAAKGF
jgi:hypothetical protein